MAHYHSKEEERDRDTEKESSSLDRINFNLKPLELKEYLDQYIIKQDRAKSP